MFASLLAVIGGWNLLVDPFGLTGWNLLGLEQAALSERHNDRLARLARFSVEPRPIVLLGDSRTRNLSEKYFADLGLDVSNLGYSGGSLYEAIESFWFAVDRIHPDHVVFGVPFNTWSEVNNTDLVATSVGLIEHPSTYFFNLHVFGLSTTNVVHSLRHEVKADLVPAMSRDEFWKYELETGAPSLFARWQRPQELRRKLVQIVRYSKSHGIDLVFFIPPTHVELQAVISRFGLEAEHDDYLAFLRSLGPVIDYDTDSPLTRDRANFNDPFHVTPAVNRFLVADLARRARLRE